MHLCDMILLSRSLMSINNMFFVDSDLFSSLIAGGKITTDNVNQITFEFRFRLIKIIPKFRTTINIDSVPN